MDYAGSFLPKHPVHGYLGGLKTGQCVFFCRNQSKMEIHDRSGKCLAMLSNEGADKWRERLDHILEVRVGPRRVWRNGDWPQLDGFPSILNI